MYDMEIKQALSTIENFRHYVYGISGALGFLSVLFSILFTALLKRISAIAEHDTRLAVDEERIERIEQDIVEIKAICRDEHKRKRK